MKKRIIFLAGCALLLAGCPRVTDKSGAAGTGSTYTVTFTHEPAAHGSITAKVRGGPLQAETRLPKTQSLYFRQVLLMATR